MTESSEDKPSPFWQWSTTAVAVQYGRVMGKTVQEPAALLERAATALMNRNPEEGRLLAQAALHLAPSAAEAHYYHGVALSHLGRMQEACASLQRATELRPDFADALMSLGILLRAEDKLEDAAGVLRRLVTVAPQSADAHNNLGIVQKELGQATAAMASYRRALALKPDAAEAHNNLGVALDDLERSDEAIMEFRAALAARPDYAEAWMNMGIALGRVGRIGEAVAAYRHAIELEADYAEAHNNLGIALTGLGNFDEALAAHRQAVSADPSYTHGHLNLGNLLRDMGHHGDAAEAFRNALSLDPNDPEVHYNLGVTELHLNNPQQALLCFEKTLAISPDHTNAQNSLGVALSKLGQLSEAVQYYRQALSRRKDFAAAQVNLANALYALRQIDEALDAYERALEIDPKHPEALANMGRVLTELGDLDRGRRAFEDAVEASPPSVRKLFDLSASREFSVDDPFLVKLENLASVVDSLSEREQVQLHFALGKAYGDTKQYARSAEHFLCANKLARSQISYDEKAELERLAMTAKQFTSEFMAEWREFGDQSDAPIFILGMPRSGTTLVEQILASHPEVFGAGELAEFENLAHQLVPSIRPVLCPGLAMVPKPSQVKQLGADYLYSVRKLAPSAARITDKMPSNFRYAGLIYLTFPNARIIHTRRDPLDTCLSCFTKLFAGHLPFTYNLAELGRYYRAYDALMTHWRAVIPSSALLEVQYEAVVDDLEGQARAIIAHCGLEWDAACLSFYKTQRAVRTASVTQVRQPIYDTSVGRWRHYQDMLQPLLAELNRDTV